MAKKSMENAKEQRDQGGRFLTGNNGGPGRRLETTDESLAYDNFHGIR
jgi:hypothetical protein